MFRCCLNRSDSFENPVLQQHFRNLEALALDMMESEQVVDLTRKECAFCCWSSVLGIEPGAYKLQGGGLLLCLVSYILRRDLSLNFNWQPRPVQYQVVLVCVCAGGNTKEDSFCF